MHEILMPPLLAGLSTGLFCGATCLPFIAPVLVAEQRTFGQTLRIWAEFLLGRLGGYVVFGALVGWLGARLDDSFINAFSTIALVLLSWLLLLYAVGLLKPDSAWACAGRRLSGGRRAPFLMGLLMGVNICPPFLLSLAYVFTLHSAARGVVYFLVFFAATTVYFVPLIFLGFLGRMRELRAVARVSAILVGLLFTAYGALAAARGMLLVHAR